MSFLIRSICFLILIPSFLITFVSASHSDQKVALLEFKNEFGMVDSKSWVNKSDCCSWDGITCDAKSGNVIGLDLSSIFPYGQLKSNSSLFKLRHLRDLNLANNNSPIPAEFDKLIGLERLDLSQSSLSGQIPINLLQLTKLVSLHLSSSEFFGDESFHYLSIDESFLPLLARNLRNLRELDMSYVKISSEIPEEFSNLRSLRFLNLNGCNLFGEFPSSILLIPNLQSIDLGNNPNLRGNLPVFHENNSLLKLTILYTSFSGAIPDSISSLKNLTSLTLSVSYFSGKIPSSLGNLSHLSYLSLSSNNLIGQIPSSIGNLNQLTNFYVGGNKLSGNLPATLSNLTKLNTISLSSNQFTARIYLSYNQLNDLVGIENIFMLPNLETFYVYHYNYTKVRPLDLNVFSSLKQLGTLYISRIPISTTNITSDFPSNLEYLSLRSCNITDFPEFIRKGRNLQILDLSNNKIKGQVPDWLWRMPTLNSVDLSNNSLSGFHVSVKASPESQLTSVDLSSNAFQGPLFLPSKSLRYFSGSNNNFTGKIPRSICGLSSLEILDLSNNNLNGSLPWCLETLMSSLSDLDLRNNSLSGSLPEIFMNATKLRSLDVSHNRMEGKLPGSLTVCSSLEVLNVGSNRINDMFPFELISLQKLQVLVLHSNKFHGTLHNVDGVWFGFPQLQIIDVSHNDFVGILPSDYFMNWTAMSSKKDNNIEPEYIQNPSVYGSSLGYYTSLVLMSKGVSMEMERVLTIYTAIDFSGNQLHGKIPDSICLLKELRILNMSRNAFTGYIPSSLANLKNLESLDISQNNISGEIPPELGTLSSLAWINVSHNQLVGSIPQGTQFQRQKCSSYEGNPGLNGPSLENVCGHIKESTPTQSEPLETKEEEEEESFSWIAAGLGFAPGVVFGLAMGYIVVSHKHQWFMKTFGRSKQQNTRTR
ncbi:unnamed protein product [Arabidopsis thaliana]|uniref:Uncharacterized protein n=1 Tax=Arabidopsis thaliana TaxID=3702 RepID=A0A5S9WKE1_ARATH|nr:unnamed protein product [Arabidopsis thaliana]